MSKPDPTPKIPTLNTAEPVSHPDLGYSVQTLEQLEAQIEALLAAHQARLRDELVTLANNYVLTHLEHARASGRSEAARDHTATTPPDHPAE